MTDVAVKSVPPRRRTKSSFRILKDNKVISSSEGIFCDNGTLNKIKVDQMITDEQENSSKVSIPDPVEKVINYLREVGYASPLTIACDY